MTVADHGKFGDLSKRTSSELVPPIAVFLFSTFVLPPKGGCVLSVVIMFKLNSLELWRWEN